MQGFISPAKCGAVLHSQVAAWWRLSFLASLKASAPHAAEPDGRLSGPAALLSSEAAFHTV